MSPGSMRGGTVLEQQRQRQAYHLADMLPQEGELLGAQLLDTLYDARQQQQSSYISGGGGEANGVGYPYMSQAELVSGMRASQALPISQEGGFPNASTPNTPHGNEYRAMPSPGSREGSQHSGLPTRASSGSFSSIFGGLTLDGGQPPNGGMGSGSGDIWGMGGGAHHGNGSNHGSSHGSNGGAFRQPEGMWMQGVPEEEDRLHGGANFGLEMGGHGEEFGGQSDGGRQRMLPAGALSLLGLKAAPPPPPKAPPAPPQTQQQQQQAAQLAAAMSSVGLTTPSAGEHPLGEHPSRTLFVRNINWSVEEVELRQLFENYGEIRAVYTACKHRGFVMISYFDLRAAKAAMRALQGRVVRRRRLDIHYSIPKDNPNDRDVNQGTLVVFNLDGCITNDDLHRIFGAYGEVKEIRETPKKKNHKFVEYYDIRAAATALHCLNHTEIAGKRIKLEPSRPGGSRRSVVQQQTRQMMEDEKRSLLHTPGSLSHWSMEEAALRKRASQQAQDGMHLYTAPAAASILQQFENFSFGGLGAGEGGHNGGLPPSHGAWAGLSLEAATAMQSSLSGASQADLAALGLLAQHAVSSGMMGHDEGGGKGQPIDINGMGRGRGAGEGGGEGWLRGGAASAPVEFSTLGGLWAPPELISHSPSTADGSGHPMGAAGYSLSPSSSMWSTPSSYAPSAPSSNNPSGHGMMMAKEHVGGHSQHGVGNWGNMASLHMDHSSNLPLGMRGRIGSASDLMNQVLINSSNAMAVQSAADFQRGLENGSLDLQELLAAAHKGQLLEAQLRAQQQAAAQMAAMDKGDKGMRRRGSSSVDPAAEAHRKAAQQKMFNLDLERVARGEDLRTTLMIKNIPNKYTQKMLLATIDDAFRGSYDFFYLPIDFKNKCNMGYAFINMVRPAGIIPLVERFDKKKWEKFNSEKICAIAYARIQGKAALISHFQNSSLMHEDKHCRPIIFASDGVMAGVQEPFPVGNNVRSRTARGSITGAAPRETAPSSLTTAAMSETAPQMIPRAAQKGSMGNLLQAAHHAELQDAAPSLSHAPFSSSF